LRNERKNGERKGGIPGQKIRGATLGGGEKDLLCDYQTQEGAFASIGLIGGWGKRKIGRVLLSGGGEANSIWGKKRNKGKDGPLEGKE